MCLVCLACPVGVPVVPVRCAWRAWSVCLTSLVCLVGVPGIPSVAGRRACCAWSVCLVNLVAVLASFITYACTYVRKYVRTYVPTDVRTYVLFHAGLLNFVFVPLDWSVCWLIGLRTCCCTYVRKLFVSLCTCCCPVSLPRHAPTCRTKGRTNPTDEIREEMKRKSAAAEDPTHARLLG